MITASVMLFVVTVPAQNCLWREFIHVVLCCYDVVEWRIELSE